VVADGQPPAGPPRRSQLSSLHYDVDVAAMMINDALYVPLSY
jgi:hypothetical protein